MSTQLCKNTHFTRLRTGIFPFRDFLNCVGSGFQESGLGDPFLILCRPWAGSWSLEERAAQSRPRGAPALGGFNVESPTSRAQKVLPSSHTHHCFVLTPWAFGCKNMLKQIEMLYVQQALYSFLSRYFACLST